MARKALINLLLSKCDNEGEIKILVFFYILVIFVYKDVVNYCVLQYPVSDTGYCVMNSYFFVKTFPIIAFEF